MRRSSTTRKCWRKNTEFSRMRLDASSGQSRSTNARGLGWISIDPEQMAISLEVGALHANVRNVFRHAGFWLDCLLLLTLARRRRRRQRKAHNHVDAAMNDEEPVRIAAIFHCEPSRVVRAPARQICDAEARRRTAATPAAPAKFPRPADRPRNQALLRLRLERCQRRRPNRP